MRSDVKRDNRNIDPPARLKGGKLPREDVNWASRDSLETSPVAAPKVRPKHVCFVFYICVAPQRRHGSYFIIFGRLLLRDRIPSAAPGRQD